MLMYIDKIMVYAPANNKCRELGLWADEWYSCCLTDGRTLDRILDEIRERMTALDEQYPRTRRMKLEIYTAIGSATKIYANIDGTTDQKAVFIMTVHRVEARYLWSDALNTPMYYGRKEEEEYRRAAERCREMGLIEDICEDDERPEITDMVSRRLTACQYPIPDLAQKPAPTAAPADDLSFGSLLRTARDFIRGIATAQDHTDTPATQPHNQHTNNTSTTMNQTEPKNLLSALKVKNLAQEDGKVMLTAEQVQALDDHLATLAAEAGKKDKEIENLKKQVQNLKKGDGDTTDDVDPDDNEDDTENYAVRARKAWNRLKTLG